MKKTYTKKDMEKAFIAGGKLAMNFEKGKTFEEFLKYLDNDTRN